MDETKSPVTINQLRHFPEFPGRLPQIWYLQQIPETLCDFSGFSRSIASTGLPLANHIQAVRVNTWKNTVKPTFREINNRTNIKYDEFSSIYNNVIRFTIFITESFYILFSFYNI